MYRLYSSPFPLRASTHSYDHPLPCLSQTYSFDKATANMAIVRSGCKKPLNIIKKARKAQAKHASKATSSKLTTSLPSHAAGARSLKRVVLRLLTP